VLGVLEELRQELHRLPGQRHEVRVTVFLLVLRPVQSGGRHIEQTVVEIELVPDRLPQFPWSQH
jgi:hypothetical protein